MIEKSIILFAMIFAFIIQDAKSQHVINSSGGEVSSSNGSVSYSLGQITNYTYSGSNGSVSTGVQQPYEISVVNAIETTFDIFLNCTIAPNPTQDYLTLRIENLNNKHFTFFLFDKSGMLLKESKISENETLINISNFTSSIYFLKVFEDHKELKTFKIIKL